MNLDLREGNAADDADRRAPDATPAEFRAARYPTLIPIGCGLFVGLCLFTLFSQRHMPMPWIPGADPSKVGAVTADPMATAAVEPGASDVPSPLGAPAPAPTKIPAVTNAPSPLNPWAAEIPEAGCIPADLPQTGRVVDVLDGDTIRVLMDRDGRVYSVHYLGIEAPNPGKGNETQGRLALARDTELVFGKEAVLVRDINEADDSGTLLRYVMVEALFVNQVLVREGLARVRMDYPDTACLETFLAAQRQAQAGELGIWEASITATGAP